jgi:hypothetical protein
MVRSLTIALLAGVIAFPAIAQASGSRVCKPSLSIKDVQFSKFDPATLERKWTATVSVDASRCAANASGYFDIGFLRAKENSFDLEFREQFIWLTPSVKVGVDFWADEAAEHFWVENITPCTCAD